MISNDEFYLQSSYQPHTDNFDFSKKEYVYIEDQQRGSYPGGTTVNFDMSSLGTNGLYSNWSESVLAVPLVMTLHTTDTTAANGLTGNVVNAFAMSLKNGYHQIINSVKCSISNQEVFNSQTLTNLKIHYDIVSGWSEQDLKSIGSVMNFQGIDNPDSERYYGVANNEGIGLCNNTIVPTNWTPLNGYGAVNEGNTSRRDRMRDTSFDPVGGSGLMTINNTSGTWNTGLAKNYVTNSVNTAAPSATVGVASAPIVWYILATIPMSQIHPLFKKLHLTKNMYMKLDFTFNTNFSTTFTLAATTFTNIANTGSAPTCPYMISPLGTATGTYPSATCTKLTASIQIGKSSTIGTTQYSHTFNSCRIYVCCYTLSPSQQQEYLTKVADKTILYNDYYYSNTNLSAIKPNDPVYNTSLFTKVKRIRGILLIPQMASSVHGSLVANLKDSSSATGIPIGSPLVSPFSSSPGSCAPYARVSNFNVLIGNRPYLSQNVNYGWEIFFNEITKSNTTFGNAIQGLSSGLLDKNAWEKNHGYVYVDLSRWESLADDNAEKNVGLSFTNSCNVTCDYHCFLIYEREIKINTSTGAIML
jgi:hypothetical protein